MKIDQRWQRLATTMAPDVGVEMKKNLVHDGVERQKQRHSLDLAPGVEA